MAGRQETTGRYCLPVHPTPPLTSHPAFRVAVWCYVAGFVAIVAAGSHRLSLSAWQRTALQVVFMLCFLGYIGIISWIRHRGFTRRAPDHGRETAG
jgi:hypothetical protein